MGQCRTDTCSIEATEKTEKIFISNFLICLKNASGEKSKSHFHDIWQLLTCGGPGLLIWELASHEHPPSMWAPEVDVVSFVEELELDIRGSVRPFGHYVTLTCDEIMSFDGGHSSYFGSKLCIYATYGYPAKCNCFCKWTYKSLSNG